MKLQPSRRKSCVHHTTMSTLLSTILPQIDTWNKVCHLEWQSNPYFLNDWLMIADLVLFSGLLSRLIVLAGGSTCVASFTVLYLNIHRSGVLTALAWLVPHETAAVSVQVLCTPYNHAPCHFMQSHICKVDACLAVTCQLHFWQNDLDLLCATTVTPGWNRYRNINPGEENSPTTPAGIWTRDLSITSPAR